MSSLRDDFPGFPGISQATAIPNLFFASVLPKMRTPSDLLAFLWLSRYVQGLKGEARFGTPHDIWAQDGAPESFEQIGGGFAGLQHGLESCVALGAALAVVLQGESDSETVYFVNNPASRRCVGRARAGDLVLKPGTQPLPVPSTVARPSIFRLYEENIGTITPLVGERLMEAMETYPTVWLEEAFRKAAEQNVRNWRYIERVLQRWAEEGRDEATAGDTLEDRKRRYLGGDLGHLVNRR